MSSLKRQLKRNQEKKWRKRAKKGFKDAINATAGLPTKCTQCQSEFDLARDADTWIVDLSPGSIQLLCPKCSGDHTKVDT